MQDDVHQIINMTLRQASTLLLEVFLCVIVLHIVCGTADADIIKVGSSELYDERVMNLPSDSKADISVFLGGSGEMLEGYKAVLRKEPIGEGEISMISDTKGVVIFKNIPAGHYTVFLRRTRSQKADSLVSVRDIRISLSATAPSNTDKPLAK